MFHGSIVAIVTPMKTDTSIDYDAFRRLIERQIEHDTDAIVVLGTTGESPTINLQERTALIKHALDQVGGRVPVIAGTGVNCTRETIELTQHAMELGVDACLVVVPYYNKPTQEGLYLHFKTVAEAVAIPQILYNHPGRTGCDMLPQTVARLAAIPNIVGIKESSGDLKRVPQLLDLCGDSLDLLTGNDDNAADFILAGGKGGISVTANVAPKLVHDLCKAALSGNRDLAMQINERLLPLNNTLFLESNPIPVKWALHEMGLIPAGIRLPMTTLAEQYRPALHAALRETGVA